MCHMLMLSARIGKSQRLLGLREPEAVAGLLADRLVGSVIVWAHTKSCVRGCIQAPTGRRAIIGGRSNLLLDSTMLHPHW